MAYGAFIVHNVQLVIRDESLGAHAELYELCEELRAAARQVNRVGVNLNQLARIANSMRSVPDELSAAVDYLMHVLRRLEAVAIEAGRRLR